MKILVPLNTTEHIKDYIEAGANEFYLGFYDLDWIKTFGKYVDINRLTGFGKEANPYSFTEILNVIEEVKRQWDVSIYITFNSSMYSNQQLEFIEEYFRQLSTTKVDGVIVSCLELVELANKYGLNSDVSTISGIYNQDIAKVYKQHGVKRIILPRDLSLAEIEEIVHATCGMEFEVFLMRNGCTYSDSNCLGFHRKELPSLCSGIRNSTHTIITQDADFKERHQVAVTNQLYRSCFHQVTCGLCSIYRFVSLGIAAGKIVGRSDDWKIICRDISFVHDNIEIAKKCSNEEEYLSQMKLIDMSTTSCNRGLSCYYPEVRF